MRHIKDIKKEDIKDIKLIVFDVDGVLVRRGTKIKQEGNTTTLETKKIAPEQISQIHRLKEKGYYININSGRGLYMLQEMFREILDFTSLTYENGSATWFDGKIYQHVNSFHQLKKVIPKLQKVKHSNIKGFEPKELIITIHCTNPVKEIDDIMSKEKDLYSIWNGEAYDIGIKNIQTKAVGLKSLIKLLKIKKNNVLVIGDNYNDSEMMAEGGIAVTADKDRVKGHFYVELEGQKLPADQLMESILKIK
ncbi:MAG: HAD family hydrolase [Nanoarchaeota archaeon]|nr:HAD family hydrolase [Nanoarchaeota archaeon]